MIKPTDEQRNNSEHSPDNTPTLAKIQKGDVFAYKLKAGYRVFCLISHAQIGDVYAAYCYVWARFFDEIPSVESLADDYVLPLGYFTSATFPSAEKLIHIGNYPEAVSSVGGLIYPHFSTKPGSPLQRLLQKKKISQKRYLFLCV